MSREQTSLLLMAGAYLVAACGWYGLQLAADLRLGRAFNWRDNLLVTIIEWLVVVGVTAWQWRPGH